MLIDQAVDKLIGIEGKYSNNPADSGGETMWGITLDTARRNGYHGAMRSLPRGEAARIYKAEFVVAPKFDKVWELSSLIGYELFDTGVNSGPGVPIKWLQENLNVLNRGGKDYPDITEDGAIGPRTLQALKAFLTLRGIEGEQVLLKMLNVDQGAFYKSLARKRQKDEAFIFGWFRTRIELPAR